MDELMLDSLEDLLDELLEEDKKLVEEIKPIISQKEIEEELDECIRGRVNTADRLIKLTEERDIILDYISALRRAITLLKGVSIWNERK